jgi:hypothetical protein
MKKQKNISSETKWTYKKNDKYHNYKENNWVHSFSFLAAKINIPFRQTSARSANGIV